MDKPSNGGPLLVGSIFVVALCGIIYELVGGTVASYLLGDSVTQYSLVIGVFLSAMGVGAYLSRFIIEGALAALIGVEIAVGLLGGLTGLVAFVAFAVSEDSDLFLLAWLFVVGTLVGLEVPLVLRLLKQTSLRTAISNLLAADYAGALVASLAFPFLLMPMFGLIRAAVLAGLANVAVALVLTLGFKEALDAERPRSLRLRIGSGVALAFLCTVFLMSGALTDYLENQLYQDEVILAKTSPQQRIIVTRYKEDVRLFLNGQLQFSTIDEYRYHESLVHPAFAAAEGAAHVLVLGGGDGMAVREILRHDDVEQVTLVDLDPAVTTLFRENKKLTALNGGALNDPRVTVLHQDAFSYIRENNASWDVIICDLPDPSELSLGKLYSDVFYRMVFARLRPGGAFVTQATSPYRAKAAFWSIADTLEAAAPTGSDLITYHIAIPTFGQWGFALVRNGMARPFRFVFPDDQRFMTARTFAAAQVFPRDMQRDEPTTVNRLTDPVVVELYRSGYNTYFD